MSEIAQLFTIRGIFRGSDKIEGDRIKYRLDFATECVNRNRGKSTPISIELADQISAYMSVKVDETTYKKIKYLLVDGEELSLEVCPLSWRSDGGSGLFYELINIEKYSEMLNVA